jgi:hypothetical protein
VSRCEARLAGASLCQGAAVWALERADGSRGLVCWAHRPRDPAGYVQAHFIGPEKGQVVPITLGKRRLRVVR